MWPISKLKAEIKAELKVDSNIEIDGFLEGFTNSPRCTFDHFSEKEKALWFKHYDLGKAKRKEQQMLDLLRKKE